MVSMVQLGYPLLVDYAITQSGPKKNPQAFKSSCVSDQRNLRDISSYYS